jgi:hypothetical protein
MEPFFAQAPLINYIGSAIFIAAPVVITLLVLSAIARKSILGTIIVGLLLILSSIPIAYMAELSLNGCCGVPSSGYVGMGYITGAIIAIAGLGIIIFVKKIVKKKIVI